MVLARFADSILAAVGGTGIALVGLLLWLQLAGEGARWQSMTFGAIAFLAIGVASGSLVGRSQSQRFVMGRWLRPVVRRALVAWVLMLVPLSIGWIWSLEGSRPAEERLSENVRAVGEATRSLVEVQPTPDARARGIIANEIAQAGAEVVRRLEDEEQDLLRQGRPDEAREQRRKKDAVIDYVAEIPVWLRTPPPAPSLEPAAVPVLPPPLPPPQGITEEITFHGRQSDLSGIVGILFPMYPILKLLGSSVSEDKKGKIVYLLGTNQQAGLNQAELNRQVEIIAEGLAPATREELGNVIADHYSSQGQETEARWARAWAENQAKNHQIVAGIIRRIRAAQPRTPDVAKGIVLRVIAGDRYPSQQFKDELEREVRKLPNGETIWNEGPGTIPSR